MASKLSKNSPFKWANGPLFIVKVPSIFSLLGLGLGLGLGFQSPTSSCSHGRANSPHYCRTSQHKHPQPRPNQRSLHLSHADHISTPTPTEPTFTTPFPCRPSQHKHPLTLTEPTFTTPFPNRPSQPFMMAEPQLWLGYIRGRATTLTRSYVKFGRTRSLGRRKWVGRARNVARSRRCGRANFLGRLGDVGRTNFLGRRRYGYHSLQMAELRTGITFDWDVRFRRSLWRWDRSKKCYLRGVGLLGYNAVTQSCFGNGESVDPGISVQYLSVSILGWTLSHWLYSLDVICISNIYLRVNFGYNTYIMIIIEMIINCCWEFSPS